MYASNDSFEYFQCPKCQTLQINECPANLSDYYPQDYYESNFTIKKNIHDYFRLKRDLSSYGQKTFTGMFLNKQIGINYNCKAFAWLQEKINISPEAKILDVGCGPGNFLLFLEKLKFKNLTGLEPYTHESYLIGKNNNIKIAKQTLEEHSGKYDLIVLNHSFEHMLEPQKAFENLKRLLAKDGHIFLRVPVLGWAWEHYKENWVQLDAPRHLFIPSLAAIDHLCSSFESRIIDIKFDSNSFQFTGSEKYLQGLALKEQVKLSKNQINEYKSKSLELNETQKGDQACFIIGN